MIFDQIIFWAYLIALLFRNNILFTELKNLTRSSNGGWRRKRRRSQISAFAIQNAGPGTYIFSFLEVKIYKNCTIVMKLL